MRRAPHLLLASLLTAFLATGTRAQGRGVDEVVSIRTRDTALASVLTAICTKAGLNLILAPEVSNKKVTLQIQRLPIRNVFRYIAGLYDVGIVTTPDERTVLVGSREAIERLDVGEAKILQLSHASAVEYAALVNKLYQGKLQAYPDPRTNTVIVVPNR